MANQIEYLFNSNAIKDVFKSCVNALKQEIKMNQIFEFNRICTISDKKVEELEENEWENKILVESHNLKKCVEFFIEEFKIDVRSLFLSDYNIEKKLKTIISNIKKDNIKTKEFSIVFLKSSDLETLFNVLYSTKIEIEYSLFKNVLCSKITFNDIDHQDLIDAIDSICEKNKEIKSYDFDRIGEEVESDKAFINIYFKFELI